MKNILVIFSFLIFPLIANAHQPDISTVILSEQKSGEWVLQVKAALTGFQIEINLDTLNKPYRSPEEFKDLLIDHVRQNFQVTFNDQIAAELGKPMVKLGHETNVIFSIKNVPEDIQSMSVQNDVFRNIYRSQTGLMVLKEGFAKKQFILNGDNDFSIKLISRGDQFEAEARTEKTGSVPLVYYALGILFLILIIFPILEFKKRSRLKIEAIS